MLLFKTSLLLILYFSMCGIVRAQNWSGLIPAKSTCKEAESIIKESACGKPKSKVKVNDENIIIYYAQKVCEKSSGYKWNVKIGTILFIDREFEKRAPMSSFDVRWQDLELIKFKSDIDEVYYNDKKEGVFYHVIDNSVYRIYYYPSAKMNFLKCKE